MSRKHKYISKHLSKNGKWVYVYELAKNKAEDLAIDAEVSVDDAAAAVKRFVNDPKWESNYAVWNAANSVRDKTKGGKSPLIKTINKGATFVSNHARHNMIVRDNELLTAHYVLTGDTYYDSARGAKMERTKARYGAGYKDYGFYRTLHGKKVSLPDWKR